MDKEHYILIFHGSDNSNLISKTDLIKNYLQNNLNKNLTICFVQKLSPSFSEALEIAHLHNTKKIVCLPMLLLPGHHLIKDIPLTVENFKKKHKNCEVKILPCLADSKYFFDFLLKTLQSNQ